MPAILWRIMLSTWRNLESLSRQASGHNYEELFLINRTDTGGLILPWARNPGVYKIEKASQAHTRSLVSALDCGWDMTSFLKPLPLWLPCYLELWVTINLFSFILLLSENCITETEKETRTTMSLTCYDDQVEILTITLLDRRWNLVVIAVSHWMHGYILIRSCESHKVSLRYKSLPSDCVCK